MKPSAFRIERLLAKVEAEVARRGPRPRRYAFHPDEVAEAEGRGLPYALVPRVLSKQEWLERYATPGAEAEFYARFRGGPVAFTRPGQPVAPAAPKPRRRSSRRRTCNREDGREALLLAERLKGRRRPGRVTLCEYVHETDETAALEPTQ